MPGAAMISVETVVQDAGRPLLRQQHRVVEGTTIRALLRDAGFDGVVAAIEKGTLGLAVHGKRAWLDDILVDDTRIEVMAPIEADAKAARAARVAADRSRRRGGVSSVR